ncbi:MAG: hypothetical protein ACFFD1_02820, partial [Candidatus Thorarchaeota archaeon]
MASIPKGSFIFVLLFIVLTLPFFLALLPQNVNATPFSIYNTGWDGLSEFKSLINDVDSTVHVETLIGSTNALNRLNTSIGAESGTLVIMGPKVSYDPTEAIAILLYLLKGGRLVIADDFGTANDILSYFSLILEAISSANLSGNNLFGLNGTVGPASVSPDTGITSIHKPIKLNLPSLFDPLQPYLQPNNPIGNKLWRMANPYYSLASTAQSVDPTQLASSGFNILQSIVAIAINQSVLIDTESYVHSPVQPLLKPPTTDINTGTLVAPWITDWTQGVTDVVGNYAAILSMKVRYPTNFTNSAGQTISYDEWFNYGLPVIAGGQGGNRSEYQASHFETLWVPFGQFDLQLPQVSGLGDILDNFKPSFKLSALYSSDKSWLEHNVTQAKDVNTISPDASEWGNIEFPVAAMFPLGFDPASPQLYIISDPSIFINKYVGTTPLSGDPNDPNYLDPTAYSNRQFSQNLLTLLLAGRSNSVIYFDEGHLAQSYLNPILYMGMFFRFIDLMTMFPLLAPFLPITIVGFARRYAPRGKKAAAPLLMTRVEQYSGRSYFAFKMRFLLEYQHYAKGLD